MLFNIAHNSHFWGGHDKERSCTKQTKEGRSIKLYQILRFFIERSQYGWRYNSVCHNSYKVSNGSKLGKVTEVA